MEAVRDAFAWNPGFKEYFAVKATPNPFLINILRDYGVDATVLRQLSCSFAMLWASRATTLCSRRMKPPQPTTRRLLSWVPLSISTIFRTSTSSNKRLAAFQKPSAAVITPVAFFEISNGIMDNPGDAKYGMTTEQLFEAFRTLEAKAPSISAFMPSCAAIP